MKTPHWPPDSPITTFCPAKPAHLLACFESQLLQGSHRQSLVLCQWGNELGSSCCHLLQHRHHPRQVFSAVEECVRYLCNGPESGTHSGLNATAPSYLRTIPVPRPDLDRNMLRPSWFCSVSFPSPFTALNLWSKSQCSRDPRRIRPWHPPPDLLAELAGITARSFQVP